ncbi:hypothetical protein F4777DRAFT_560156 [Nemania sp. FL0916]|nr:hypothetical protein F4777DRAFT_560156 [Nemania sp. FL0916]
MGFSGRTAAGTVRQLWVVFATFGLAALTATQIHRLAFKPVPQPKLLCTRLCITPLLLQLSWSMSSGSYYRTCLIVYCPGRLVTPLALLASRSTLFVHGCSTCKRFDPPPLLPS